MVDRDETMENEPSNINFKGWLWLAPQYFNQWRIFPRAFIVFYFWLCFETATWFMGLPTPGAAQAAFASAIISAGAAWFGLYVNSGPKSLDMPSPRTQQPVIQSATPENYDTDAQHRSEPGLQRRHEPSYTETPRG